MNRRQIPEPVQWAIIIGLTIAALGVAYALLAIGRIVIVVAWAAFS